MKEIGLFLPVAYLLSYSFNPKHKYLHFLVPLLGMVLYMINKSLFILKDEGSTTSIFLYYELVLLLIFLSKYIDNYFLHKITIVLCYISVLPFIFLIVFG